VFISPTVVGETVIVGSCAGTLYALDRKSGQPRWQYDTKADGPAAQFHGEPLLLGKRLIVAADSDPKGHLYAFDSATGDLQWKLPFEQGVAATPLLVDGRVIAVSMRGEVVAVDPNRGAIVWRATPAGALTPLPYVPSPASAGKRIFVADNKNQVFALDAATGATLWHTTLSGRPNTALAVVGDALVLGTADGNLHWLALDSGEGKKRVHVEGIPYGTPMLAPPMLFVLAGNKLLALDAASGAVRWKQETPAEWTTYRPLVTGAIVIAGTEEKTLCAFDRATGATCWCRSVGQVPRGLGVSADGVLYVGSLSGVVQAFTLPACRP
jgi:outer membrane protein assembly factor BamB